MSNIDEKLNFIKEKRQKQNQDEFEKMYKEYKRTVKHFSGGLVKTNRSDFIKLYAFYSTVDHPNMVKMWEAYLGKK